jgi:hypothetical protein
MAEAMGRRADYQFPTGMRLIGEYWSASSNPSVVAIYEADDPAALTVNSIAWLDMFDVQVFPVTTYEEGLEKLTRRLAGE